MADLLRLNSSGVMPFAGGWQDQPPVFVSAASVFDIASAAARAAMEKLRNA